MKAHDYSRFAAEFAQREIVGTSYLAFRDIPDIIDKYVKGKYILDYGCGAGRSTRFLKKLGFNVTGVDISSEMINQAKIRDQKGEYLLIESGKLPFKDSTFDLVFCNAVFLEIPKKEEIISILLEMKRVIKVDSVVIITTETEEAYFGEWESCICPQKYAVRSGDKIPVHIKNTNIELYDYYWIDSDYKECFMKSGFRIVEKNLPLASGNEGIKWVQETQKPHWVTYVLKKN